MSDSTPHDDTVTPSTDAEVQAPESLATANPAAENAAPEAAVENAVPEAVVESTIVESAEPAAVVESVVVVENVAPEAVVAPAPLSHGEETTDSALSSANETKAYDRSALVAAAFETSETPVTQVDPAPAFASESVETPAPVVEPAAAAPIAVDASVDAPATEAELPEPVAAESVKRETYIPAAAIGTAAVGAATLAAADAPTAYVPGAPAAAAPAAAPAGDTWVAAPVAPTPIYVQAPTPPTPAGNRAGGILIALVATVAYAVLFAIAAFVIAAVTSVTIEQTVTTFSDILTSGIYYIPVIFFFIGFALLIAIVNRGGWWAYVLFSFFVAVIVYFSYIGGALITVQAWTMTPSEAAAFIGTQWLHPFAIVAAVIAREVPIWFGAWIAARGRKVTARNIEARQEYDRLINEGPQLTSPV